jgi:hypothetical protein
MADELTQEEVYALAGAFPVATARTLLTLAGFPSYALPETGFGNALDFWSAVAEQVAVGVMADGRRQILAAARRRLPSSDKFADPARVTAPAAQLRVLVIGASPDDLPHVRVDRESRAIEKAALPGRTEVKVAHAAEATDVELVGSFRPDIVHFVCHGDGDSLLFNDTRGEADAVKAARIAELLGYYRDANEVRLRGIVLAACDGHSLAPFFTGVAGTVIAHRGALADPCGVAFAQQLYTRLNSTSDLAAAAREAAQLTAQLSSTCAAVISNLIVLTGRLPVS